MTLLSDADGTAAGMFDTEMTREDAGFPVPFGVLTPEEREDRDQCETIFKHNNRTFDECVEMGKALRRFRDRKLYRETHDTFENYCLERLEHTRQHINRLIAAVDVAADLEPTGSKPNSERQIRPLYSLSPDLRPKAWQRAVETAPNGKITAAHVESVAREYRLPRDDGEPKEWTLHNAPRRLAVALYEISQKWPQEHINVMAEQLHSLADELLEYGELRP